MVIRFIFMMLSFFYCSICFASSYSGLWWDSAKAGQGISIIQEGQNIYGAWYLYDENGQDMWLTFVGTIHDNVMTAQLLRFTGPPQGQQWDETMLKSTVAGSITLTFQDAEKAQMHYQVNGVSGDLNLTAFANDSAMLYWDTSKQGQGVGIFQEGSTTYAVWYLYDKTGKDMWLTVPDLSLDGAQKSVLLRFRGPRLGAQWDPEMVSSISAGSATFTKTGASSITMDYQLPAGNGVLNLSPFIMSDTAVAENGQNPAEVDDTSSAEAGNDTALVMVHAYITFQRDGGQGNCGEEPWLSSDCISLKDWWGVNCYLVVYIGALAIKDGEGRWVITDQEDVVSRYGYTDHIFFNGSTQVYYYDLEFTYVTSPCQANIEGIDFDPHVLGTVENGVIDLTYLAEPQFRGWGSCGPAAFDWINDAIKYGWGMAVSGDPLDLTGKVYLEDQIAPGTYTHTYSVETNPSPQNRDHVTAELGLMCVTQDPKDSKNFINTACPWE